MPGLVSNLTSSAIDKFDRKISGKGCQSMKRIYVTSNEDMNDIIKIVKSLEDSCVLIDGVTETVRHEIKKKEDGFLEALLVSLAASLVQPAIFSEVKGISGRGFRKAER